MLSLMTQKLISAPGLTGLAAARVLCTRAQKARHAPERLIIADKGGMKTKVCEGNENSRDFASPVRAPCASLLGVTEPRSVRKSFARFLRINTEPRARNVPGPQTVLKPRMNT